MSRPYPKDIVVSWRHHLRPLAPNSLPASMRWIGGFACFGTAKNYQLVSAAAFCRWRVGWSAARPLYLGSNRRRQLAPDPCFLESDFVSVADEAIFSSNIQPSFYAIFTAPGRKSFFSDSGVKFGLAIVANQVRAYGKYADCYLPVSIDRDVDYDESIVMINPYRKDIIARILFSDGRSLDRIRINGGSARFILLSDILEAGENSWSGSLQITANNRIITFSVKHSLANPEIIHDYEHLESYRADRTHLPLFRKLRQYYGAYRANLV